jgi:hypothetical protein
LCRRRGFEEGQRLAKEHLDEVFVADKRRQDSFETDPLLEVARTTANRDKRLGHPPDTEPSSQLVVAKTFGGRRGHERTKVPRLTVRVALRDTSA